MTKHPLHIAHFTNTYLPVTNGVVRSVHSFRRAQTALGHNVFVFAQDAPKYEDEEPFIFRYPSFNVPIRNYPVTIPVSPFIDWVLPILKPDVIHAHHPAPIGTAASDKAEKLNIPLVFTHHTRYQEYAQYMGIPTELAVRLLERLLADYMQKCQHVIVPSESIRRLLEETYGIVERVSVVPTGIDLRPYQLADGTHIRQSRGWSAQTKVIISVGRLVEEKNFATLIRAFAQAHARVPKTLLVLIGDGPQQKSLQKLSQELNIQDAVVFLGRVPYEQVPAHLKAADLFAFASVTETQGLVTMEAMAAGLPVTAVDATGTSDIVQHGKNGLLCPNLPEALAEIMEQVLVDEALAAQLREKARETAVNFEISATALRTISVYHQAIEDKKAGHTVKTDRQKPIFKIQWDKLLEGLNLTG
ncbi:MAG: glycosyltransferase family 4 protein [Candidatus Promineifilaceae bacterium]